MGNIHITVVKGVTAGDKWVTQMPPTATLLSACQPAQHMGDTHITLRSLQPVSSGISLLLCPWVQGLQRIQTPWVQG